MKTRIEKFMKQGIKAQKAVDALTKPPHTPTPWYSTHPSKNRDRDNVWHIYDANHDHVASVFSHETFIKVKNAVNSHQALLTLAKSLLYNYVINKARYDGTFEKAEKIIAHAEGR